MPLEWWRGLQPNFPKREFISAPIAPVLKVLLFQAESAVLLELSRTKSSSKHAYSREFHTSLLKRIIFIIIFRGRCYCITDTA